MENNYQLQFIEGYKSIKSFKNTDLPSLCVICGPNGSGKSHFLNAINERLISANDISGKSLTSRVFQGTPDLFATNVTVETLLDVKQASKDVIDLIDAIDRALKDDTIKSTLIEDSWILLTPATLIQSIEWCIRADKRLSFTPLSEQQELDIFRYYDDSVSPNKECFRWDAFKRYVPLSLISKFDEFDAEKMKSEILSFVEYQTFMNIDVSIIFYRYFEEQQNNIVRRASSVGSLSNRDFIKKYGNPPWDEVNNLLKKYNFNHQLVPPSIEDDPRAINGYTATVTNDRGEKIDVIDLSSGEKVIVALLLSVYATQQQEKSIFYIDAPELMLFDELDAHLHPSMTKMMFEVLKTSFVDKLHSRVLITTHSPSTVSLAPSESLRKLVPGNKHRLDIIDQATACRDLSEGFIQLMDGSQVLIVEGKDDPLFYRAVERALRVNGDLIDIPTLHFIPASQSNNPSIGGGVAAAQDWANKLNDTNLPNIHALLDNDGNRSDNGIIKVLEGRYSIENFILDPLSLAITLITDQKLSLVDSEIAKKFSQVSSIKSSTLADIQDLANKICTFVEQSSNNLTSSGVKAVKYNFGKILQLPSWICDNRGKDLIGIVREAFKKPDNNYVITRKDHGDYDLELGYLLKLWSQHPELFPEDLVNSLKKFKS